MLGVARYCKPFVEYGEHEHRAVSQESLQLYFAAPQCGGHGRACGYFRPSLPAVDLSLSNHQQPEWGH
jgi:hypothetical protein